LHGHSLSINRGLRLCGILNLSFCHDCL